MTSPTRSFAGTLIEILFLSFVAAPCGALAGSVAQVGSAGDPPQSAAPVLATEKVSDNVRLLQSSAEGASMPFQARHRVFHRSLLGAATAYVAILAVALLILVCARRLSNLTVGEGRVRSLASADGDEPAGACGGSAEKGGEEEDHEGDPAWREAIVKQAEESMRGFKKMMRALMALKSGHNFKAVTSATSVFVLVVCEMGPLGAFIDDELRPLRQLWLSVMKEALESAQALGTGWWAAEITPSMKDVHFMNGDLLELISSIRAAENREKLHVKVSRWTALQNLVRVQAVAIEVACTYLSVLDPASNAGLQARRRALTRVGSLSDARRRMILADPSLAAYFASFQLRQFARKRFGASAAQTAQHSNLPFNPEDQIKFLREHFPTDLGVPPQDAAAAVSTPSCPDTTPASEGEKGSLPSHELPIHPPGSLVQPAGPPEPPQAPSAQLQGTLMQPAGTVRSLAGAEGDEPGGACGGHAAGGGEEESVEENESSQEAIIQQAKENMRRTKEMISILVALKSGYNYKAVNSATSVFVLVLSDMGLLGGFVDNELRSLRELWLSAMEEAVESAQALDTGRFATDTTSSLIRIHRMNGELVALMSTIRTADKNGKLVVEGSRWTALQGLVRVQEVVLDMACAYLSVLHPASGANTRARRHALGRLGSLSHTRRRMVLANKSYASYFRRFQLRGFARKRFGELGAQLARETYLPSSPQDQINYLREHFATDLKVRPQEAAAAVRPQEAAAAVSTHSPPDAAPTSEGEKAPLPSQGLTMQPPASLVQPATTPEPPQAPSAQLQETPVQPVGPPQPSQGLPMQPPGPAVQPAGPPSASGLGPQGPHPFEKSGARPKTHSTVAATGGKKSSEMPSKKPSSGVPQVAQLHAGTPKDPTGAGLPFAPSSDTGTYSTGEALPEFGAEAEGGAAEEPHTPVDDLIQRLSAYALGEDKPATADVVDEVEQEIDPFDDSLVHPGQTMHALLPTQEQVPFSSIPLAAPGTPVGPPMAGVGPFFSPLSNAFFEYPQGAPGPLYPEPSVPPGLSGPPLFPVPVGHTLQWVPGPPEGPPGVPRPPILRPSVAPGFSGPPHFAAPVWHILQGPSGSFGVPLENPPMSPFQEPLPLRGFAGPVRQILQRPPGPPGGPYGIPRPFILGPSSPRGFTGPAAQILQRPPGPSGGPLEAPRPPMLGPSSPSGFTGPVKQILQRPSGPSGGPPRAPMPPMLGPSSPSGFTGPVKQILQRPSGPSGDSRGAPVPPMLGPSSPSGFTGPVKQILQKPSGPSGGSRGAPVPPMLGPSSPSGFTGPVKQILKRPSGPSGGPPRAPRPPIHKPLSPPGSTEPSPFAGVVKQILQRPLQPSSSQSATSGSQVFKPSLGAAQQSLSGDLSPSPSAPPPSGLHPSSPSQPTIGSPTLLSAFQPSIESSPADSTPVESALETLPPSTMQPSVGELSSSVHSAPAASEGSASEASPTQEESSPSTSGAFHGEATDEMEPSVTAVSTAPPS